MTTYERDRLKFPTIAPKYVFQTKKRAISLALLQLHGLLTGEETKDKIFFSFVRSTAQFVLYVNLSQKSNLKSDFLIWPTYGGIRIFIKLYTHEIFEHWFFPSNSFSGATDLCLNTHDRQFFAEIFQLDDDDDSVLRT
jgi:hypothetical protein